MTSFMNAVAIIDKANSNKYAISTSPYSDMPEVLEEAFSMCIQQTKELIENLPDECESQQGYREIHNFKGMCLALGLTSLSAETQAYLLNRHMYNKDIFKEQLQEALEDFLIFSK